MNAETDKFYGRDDPTATYKWGVAVASEFSDWRIIAWFKTRKAAIAYGKRMTARTQFAIARIY